ncbi:amidinotransferase [Caldalkalibacillus thermarum]|uniref:dimethylarginine dimethylaminohydrolase family protein n=1 Tax=Caldalkalibacillus thermarum TaxID=296745 RepID=UPI00166A1B17|nr:arginine deiminase family protein [Caldalkalibacillus thermarum]GGK35107.1 amidinotransferase [Caldalkalibacillus thermarum]
MVKVQVQGECWFPSEKTFSEEMNDIWGDWYCDSEVGTLRAVLMRRPGKEIEFVKESNYSQYRWKAPMNPERARAQQDALAQIYRDHGVTVHYVEEQREDRPNALYMRDLVLMTPEGAIVCRPAIAARRGEERYAAQALARLGVPIIKTINGDGYFEGACAMWVDRHTVIIGTGARANRSGAAQVEAELRNIGVTDIIHFEIPYGHAHLDGLINLADRKTAVLFPWQVSYDVVKALLDKGFHIVEATNIEEVKGKLSLNFVALEPGKVVMPAGCPDTKAKMEDAGIQVIEAEMDEILKGWGAIHCMTVFLRRDPISQ